MSLNLRRRVLTLIGRPREPWELAAMASTVCRPVTAQAVLSVLIDLERDDRARQVGSCWERIAADPAKQYQPIPTPAALPANSVFQWRA